MQISMQPIATVHSPYTRTGERIPRREIIADIHIYEALAPALTGIEEWSHLFVIFWMHELASAPLRLTTHPRHRTDLPEVGVLAARGRERPNPIGLAVVELLERKGAVLRVRGLDAYDGTPVLDIKPYDQYDAIKELRAPQWWLSVANLTQVTPSTLAGKD
ncbi:MAG: tRNA (N6-threonylcarbamoyladenosine(37)-N6)-methyltransferase TrmO [Gammaproteobacteria bacterium]